jgi:hypothetical protein
MKRRGGFADYAKSYAQAALELGDSQNAVVISKGNAVEVLHQKTGKMMVGEELKVQLLYVLSNLGSWRGKRAREVKNVLKEAAK